MGMNRHAPRQARPPPLHIRIPQGQHHGFFFRAIPTGSNLLLLVVMAAYGRSRSRSVASSSETVASREAIRASRCSSHSSRWVTSRESLLLRAESSNVTLLGAASVKFPTVRPKLLGL